MEKKSFAINGRFLTRPLTGVDRFACEIVKQLDVIVEGGDVLLALPARSRLFTELDLRNIKTVRLGDNEGHLWEQRDFSSFLRKNHLTGINLCNTAPVFNPGFVCVHDMAIRRHPEYFSKKFVAAYRILFSLLAKNADKVITVSDFSKCEIERFYPAAKGKIAVIPNAWQHIDSIKADDSVISKNGLVSGEYWFAMSSLAPNKNLKWIAETAKMNPQEQFAVAGGINQKVFGRGDIPQSSNIKYLGYVEDAQAKALMSHSKAFLFPTFYEGFGIPPMEAMACGVSAIVSDSQTMREIYGESVSYIDPFSPTAELDSLLSARTLDCSCVLSQYSWTASARKLYGLMNEK